MKSSIIKQFWQSKSGRKILKEISDLNIHSGEERDVNDGLVMFHSNIEQYKRMTQQEAESIGQTVLNYLIGKSDFMIKKLSSRYAGEFTEDGSYYDDVEYRTAKWMPQVTFFDKGSEFNKPGTGTTYYHDMKGHPAYKKWQQRIMQVAGIAGWTFIDWLDANQSVDDTKTFPPKPDYDIPPEIDNHKKQV